MNERILLLLLQIVLLPTYAFGGDVIYKSTDSQGRPIFSDRPLSPAAERLVVNVGAANSPEAKARADGELAALQRAESVRQAAAETEKAARAEKEKAAAERSRSCEQARKRAQTLENEQRIFRFDEKGERIYPSSQELETQREEVRNRIEEYCN